MRVQNLRSVLSVKLLARYTKVRRLGGMIYESANAVQLFKDLAMFSVLVVEFDAMG